MCGFVTQTWRKDPKCNHNQDEEGTPRPLVKMGEPKTVNALYVRAWIAYHLAVEKTEGFRPQAAKTAQDLALQQEAVRLGIAAQVRVMNQFKVPIPVDQEGRRAWNVANQHALKILGKDRD